jgi:hypothetical protein
MQSTVKPFADGDVVVYVEDEALRKRREISLRLSLHSLALSKVIKCDEETRSWSVASAYTHVTFATFDCVFRAYR